VDSKAELAFDTLYKKVEYQAIIHDFIELTVPDQDPEVLFLSHSTPLLEAFKRLHYSFQYTHQHGRINPADDLFYSDSLSKGIALPLSAKEEAFIKEHAETLNLPKRFMQFIDSFWHNPAMEAKMMTEVLHWLA
jgi:hypothetical protein